MAKAVQVLGINEGSGYGDGGTPGTGQIAYLIVLHNYGTQAVANLQVVEDLVATFGTGPTWSIVNISAPTLSLNPGYDGRGNTQMLAGTDSLAAGSTRIIRITLNVQFVPGQVYVNQVVGSGLIGGTPVSDLSQEGGNPAPSGNPAVDNTPTSVRLGSQRIPALSPWSLGLLLLGLGLIAWRRQRRQAEGGG